MFYAHQLRGDVGGGVRRDHPAVAHAASRPRTSTISAALERRNPLHALLVLFVMASLAGVPPFLGFWAKLVVLGAALDAGMTVAGHPVAWFAR